MNNPKQKIVWDEEKTRELALALSDPESPHSKELQARIDAYVAENQYHVDAILEGERIPDDMWYQTFS